MFRARPPTRTLGNLTRFVEKVLLGKAAVISSMKWPLSRALHEEYCNAMPENNRITDSEDLEAQWSRILSRAVNSADEKHKLFEENGTEGRPKTYVDLTTLQRLNIYNLQRELVLCVKEILDAEERNKQIPLRIVDKLPELLSSYCEPSRHL
jgi:hypothetical protein